MKEPSIRSSLFLLVFILSILVVVNQSLFASPKLSPDLAQSKEESASLTNIVVDVTYKPESTYPGQFYTFIFDVYNLTGENQDSLKLIFYAPNILKLESIPQKDSLYTWFYRLDADDSVDSTKVDTNNDDGKNPKAKLRKLTLYLKELIQAGNAVDTEPHFHFEVVLRVDRNILTASLEFQIETYRGDHYVTAAGASWSAQIIELPNFVIGKNAAPSSIFAPGASGEFIITYRSPKISAPQQIMIRDSFPMQLEFLNSNPAYDSVRNNEYIWNDQLEQSDQNKYIHINFKNNYLRKDLINRNAVVIGQPVNLTNYGSLWWRGNVDTMFYKSIIIQAEPDLVPQLIKMDTTKVYSPGSKAYLQTIIKNIGGSDVVDREFSLEFKYAQLISGIPQTKVTIDKVPCYISNDNSLHPAKNDSLINFIDWDIPNIGGQYRIYVEVDADSVIEELDDVWAKGLMAAADDNFLANNIDSLDIFIGITEIDVNITHISLADTVTTKIDPPLYGGFPDYVISYITVTDQNNNPIMGLADTTRWLTAHDMVSSMNVPVDSIWQPLKEYYRDNPARPVDNNIYHTSPEFKITEVTERTAQTLSGEVLSAALVMDYSGSMGDLDIAGAQLATKAFVDEMRSQDQATVIKFGSAVAIVQELTSDKNSLKNSIDAPSPVGGSTAMLDAIYQGLASLINAPGRKIVVVYTDGGDNTSTVGMPAVITYAQMLGIPVYTIGYGSQIVPENLQEIAIRTGGEYYFSDNWQEISSFFTKIAYAVKNFYIMAHTTTSNSTDGLWRAVDVSVNYLGYADSDTGHYKPPAAGIDVWVTESSFADSTKRDSVTGQIITKYASPGDTVSYVITYGNNGYEPATNVTLNKILPEYIRRNQVLQVTPQENMSSDSTLTWMINSIPMNGVGNITFDVVIPDSMPKYIVPLYDTVNISCLGERPDSLDNNMAVDTVLVLPFDHVISPPRIWVDPVEVSVNDPVTIFINTLAPLKNWKIWIQYPATSSLGVDSIIYEQQIQGSKIEPLMPMAPNDLLLIQPPFTNTQIWGDVKDCEQRETYVVILDYVDIFGVHGQTSCSFDVVAQFELVLSSNRIPPADGADFTISFSLVRTEDVKIKIYNVAGELVQTLVDGALPAGDQTVPWNGLDKDGRLAGNDVYIILFEIDVCKLWRKVIVLR